MDWTMRFFLVIFTFHSALCREGFIYNSDVGVSYRLYEIPQTWLNAKITCDESGTKLAMPKNADEAKVMLNLFERYLNSTALENPDDQKVYVNSHHMFERYEFITDGYHLEYFYHIMNEADNPGGLPDQYCLTMDVNGVLHPQTCDKRRIYFCQIEDIPYVEFLQNTKSRAILSNDPTYKFDSNSKKYFKLHLDAKRWSLARKICHAEGGRLAIIEDKNVENFIKIMYSQKDPWFLATTDYAHIGYHDYFREGLYYTTADKPLNELGYVNWSNGQPNSTNLNERCISIDKSGQLIVIDCSVNTIFFCERNFN